MSELADALRAAWRSGKPFVPGSKGDIDYEAFAEAVKQEIWTNPTYLERAQTLKREIERQQVRNAALVEAMTLLRARQGLPGLNALIWEMANAGPGMSGAYWATRLEALVRGDEPPTPKTPDEKRAFSRAWDERHDRSHRGT